MKKTLFLILTLVLTIACSDQRTINIVVKNDLDIDRSKEMVEVDYDDICSTLQLKDSSQFIVLDAKNEEIPYQITFDNKVIFPTKVDKNSQTTYTIKKGTPQPVKTKACGKQYPERLDDIAWENDLVAFRTYGPALQERGDKAYGYDVFTKYNTTDPVVEKRYEGECNKDKRRLVAILKKKDPKAAQHLFDSLSYHIDHGNGMDCYAAGPTLGGGTTALTYKGKIIYPQCYKEYKILDNGPLRFTMELTYTPLTIGENKNVIEKRVISIDAGSYLNKTVITYDHLNNTTPIVTGIVLHEEAGTLTADRENGFITYVEPTVKPNNPDYGKMFMGAAFPHNLKDAKPVMFSEKERTELRGGAYGHVLAFSEYEPKSEYVYYWGSAWSKAAIKTAQEWDKYMMEYAQKVRNPLQVNIVK